MLLKGLTRTLGTGLLLTFLGTGALWAAPKPSKRAANELRIASSMTFADSLPDLALDYEKASGVKIRFNFAGSDRMAEQLRLKVPTDLILVAGNEWMDAVDREKLIRAGSRTVVASCPLVIIVNRDSPLIIRDGPDLVTPKIRRIALGNPDRIPSGARSRRYLEIHGIWPQLQSKIVPTENGRATLAAIEADRADVGFVFLPDALISRQVRIACPVPVEEIPLTPFVVAVTATSPRPDAARAFINYMTGGKAQAILKRYGFTPVR